MSAALDAVNAYAAFKSQYGTAFGRAIDADLDLWDRLQDMAADGELSCTAEAAFDTFVNNRKKVSLLGEDPNLWQACWDTLYDEVRDQARSLGIFVEDPDEWGETR